MVADAPPQPRQKPAKTKKVMPGVFVFAKRLILGRAVGRTETTVYAGVKNA